MARLNPIQESDFIENEFREYLKDTFNFSDKEYQQQFVKELDRQSLYKGPYLNVSLPFVSTKSINELIEEGKVSPLFRKLNNVNLDQKLYKHQEQSIDKICNGKNVVITTGTGSGKTEFIKYLAAHTKENEKIITIEDTLELHLDKIFPHRDIVAMKTNNIASYSDVLVTCMRQNPRWILLSEVRSAEAVMAVRNSISSGHNILSTIHADKAESIPSRMYSLLETNQDVEQFLTTIHRYVQLGVHIKGYYSQKYKRFHREVSEVVEFYVTDDNKAEYKILYKKTPDGHETVANPSKYLLSYLESQGIIMPPDILVKEEFKSIDNTNATDNNEFVIDNSIVKNELPQNNTINNNVNNNPNIAWSVPNIINQNNNPQNIQGNIPNPNMYTNQSIPRPININNISNR